MRIDDIVIGEEYATKSGRRLKAIAIEKVTRPVSGYWNAPKTQRLVSVQFFKDGEPVEGWQHLEARKIAMTYAAFVENAQRRETQRLENLRNEDASIEELNLFLPVLTATIGIDLLDNSTYHAGRTTISLHLPREAVRKLREALKQQEQA